LVGLQVLSAAKLRVLDIRTRKVCVSEAGISEIRSRHRSRIEMGCSQISFCKTRVIRIRVLQMGTEQIGMFRVRIDEFRGNMQNGPAGDPQALRQTFQEFRTWSETELTTLFGSETAGKIMEEGGGLGMGRGGQGMFGGGPGGDRQGAAGATGSGAAVRRGRNAGAGSAPATVPDGGGAPPAGGGGGG